MTWELAGRYRLTGAVAGGPTGTLWRAVDSGTGHPVAVKLLHPHLATDPRVADQLLRARRTLTALWHPGIARLLDVVHEPPALALVADYVVGRDLAQVLAANGRLPPARAAAVAAAVADALDAAHRSGVVHGDLKPTNVIVSAHGGEAVRLTDFSLATLARVGQPQHAAVEVSPYSPPWMIEGGMPTPACDLYALGTVLHEMLTGTTATTDRVVPVDPRLRELVEACRAGSHAGPPAAGEVAERLRELGPHLPPPPAVPRRRAGPSARPGASSREIRRADPPRPDHRPRAAGRPRRWALIGLAVALVVAGSVAVAGMLRSSAGTAPAEDRTTVAATGPAPTRPPAADQLTQAGGTAFVEYWLAVLSHASGTGDTAALVDNSSPQCDQCRSAVTHVESVYGQGGRLRGGGYVVRNVTVASFWSEDQPIYDVTVDRSARTVVEASGSERPDLPALSFATCTLSLEWSEQRWLVRQVVTPGCVA